MPGADSRDPYPEITKLLQENRSEEAVAAAAARLALTPDDGILNMVYGIALAQVGSIDLATASLRKATMLSPGNPETFANLALHLYDQGDRKEAAEMAREALRIEPDHAGASSTLAQCEAPSEPVEFEVSHQGIVREEVAIRPGLDNPSKPIFELGHGWTLVGYGILAFSVAATILIVVHLPFEKAETGTALRKDGFSVFIIFSWITSGILAASWMLVDVVDRRKRFHWLLPMSVCCLADLSFVPLGMYLLFGRKLT